MNLELFNPPSVEAQAAQANQPIPAGLLYGYSAYTTFKMPISEQDIDLHLQRLKKDCKALGLQWRYTDHQVMKRIKDLFHPSEPVFRLTVCATIAEYGDFYANEDSLPSQLLITSRPAPAKPTSGLKLKTVAYQRPLPTIKHAAMAETILLKRQARAEGFDDILLMNARGHVVCEGSTANIFLIRESGLQTPDPVRDGCLPGITRQQVLDGANTQRIPVSLEPITLSELQFVQGAFLTNAVQGLIPVQSIDKWTLPWPDCAKRLSAAIGHIIHT